MLREIFSDILPVIMFTGGSIMFVFIARIIKNIGKKIRKIKRALESLEMNKCTYCIREKEKKTAHPAR